MRHDTAMEEKSQKLIIIMHYNATISTIKYNEYMENKDKSLASCTVLFMSCVDVGAAVAFVIWVENCPAWKSTKGKRRRTIVFHKLGQELETPHVRRRAEIPVLRTSI